MYENFVGTWETVRNREVSVLERCPHGEVRLRNRAKYMGLGSNDCVVNNYKHMILFLTRSEQILIWFGWISSHRRPMYSIG